jgi:hypothetical protein
MLTRESSLKVIIDGLAWLDAKCELGGILHLLDVNVISHHFFSRFLSKVYDINLVVTDRIQPNFPAIDLADEANKRSFQVTSEKKSSKVTKSLKMFVKKGYQNKYGVIQILVIGKKQGTYDKVVVPPELTFKVATDIIDTKDLVKLVETFETAKLWQLAQIVQEEVNFTALPSGTEQLQKRLRVQYFAANPATITQLELTKEITALRSKLGYARALRAIDLTNMWIDHYQGFEKALQNVEPRILQITGIGKAVTPFMLKPSTGVFTAIPAEVLGNLFKHLRGLVNIVVIDRCMTDEQVEAIEKEIECTLRIREAASPSAVTNFLASFYRSLDSGAYVQAAFDYAKSALLIENIATDSFSLTHSEGVDLTKLALLAPYDTDVSSDSGIKFVQIEMATDKCLWQEMERGKAPHPVNHPLSGKP